MLFWAYDRMITNAYIIFKDISQSPDAITHTEFRLRCAWSLNLTGAGQTPTLSLPVCKGKIHPV